MPRSRSSADKRGLDAPAAAHRQLLAGARLEQAGEDAARAVAYLHAGGSSVRAGDPPRDLVGRQDGAGEARPRGPRAACPTRRSCSRPGRGSSRRTRPAAPRLRRRRGPCRSAPRRAPRRRKSRRPTQASGRPTACSRCCSGHGSAGRRRRRCPGSSVRCASPGASRMRSGSSAMPSSATTASRRATAAELAREHAHERDRQMLGDEDRHADRLRQRVEQCAERMDAAGRRADREHVDRVARHRPKQRLRPRAGRDRRAAAGPTAKPSAFSLPSRISENLPLKRPVPGLGSVSAAPSASAATVCSAPSSASDETIMTLAPRGRGDDPRNRFEAAGAGHFEVEQDDVDAAFAKRLDGVFGGAGDGGDLERRIAFDHPRQDRSGDRRIVDDHQPDPAAWIARVRKAVPRSGERPLHGPALRRRRRAEA